MSSFWSRNISLSIFGESHGPAIGVVIDNLPPGEYIDLEKLHKGDYMLQCFAAFVNLSDPTPGADPLVTVLEEVDVRSAE